MSDSPSRRESRRGLLLALPAYIYLLTFFVAPLGFVVTYSFARRGNSGRAELGDWTLEAYRRLGDPLVRDVILRSVVLATLTTVLCLVLAYPLALFMATRRPHWRNAMLVMVMIPFWSNFLVRNYAWRVLLGNNGPIARLTEALGLGTTRILFTPTAVVLGLVYSFLPFMILPLYSSIERIDINLVEASRDLYGSGWQTLRRVLVPLSMPGVIGGSTLVFVPSLGAYVTPEILGGAKTTMLGSYIVTQFGAARNWPAGSALSVLLMIVLLISTLIYFRKGGRTL